MFHQSGLLFLSEPRERPKDVTTERTGAVRCNPTNPSIPFRAGSQGKWILEENKHREEDYRCSLQEPLDEITEKTLSGLVPF